MFVFNPRDPKEFWNYSKDAGFTAFASDVFGSQEPPTVFKFLNPVTGTSMYMDLKDVRRSTEGEITTFVYHCASVFTTDPAVDIKQVRKIVAHVFND